MAKQKVHLILVRATFRKAVTSSEAMREVRDLAAMSYEDHSTSFVDNDTSFKLRAVKPFRGGRDAPQA
jgi:hypothetical protein